MNNAHLVTYLNDHLAGSVVALELLDGLEREHAGTPIARFAAGLRAEIEQDRGELETLMARLDITESLPRKAVAWLAEKATALKLRLDDPHQGALRQLESFEGLSLGIEGKRLLWRSLQAASAGNPDLQGLEYDRLAGRAEEQRRGLEPLRIEAAQAAFGGGSSDRGVA